MGIPFKCCKNKEFSNLCCIKCLDVYHPSCIDRKKYSKQLGGHKIYCSESCEKLDAEEKRHKDILQGINSKLKQENHEKMMFIEKLEIQSMERVEELQLTIDKLTVEIKEKDTYIKRIQRRTQDFESEIAEQENRDDRIFKEQMDKMTKLNTELKNLKQKEYMYEEEIETKTLMVRTLENDIKELNILSRNMVETIRIIELQNERYCKELTELSKELNQYKQGDSQYKAARVKTSNDKMVIEEMQLEQVDEHHVKRRDNSSETINNGKLRKLARVDNGVKNMEVRNDSKIEFGTKLKEDIKNKILILSDQYGRGLGKTLQFHMGCTTVQTITKPNAKYEHIINNAVKLSEDFTLADNMVIIAGYNDFQQGKYPSFRNINDII
ncbi:unnamed protein product [Phaedon cochleariae]|uniref:Uncharacterized protein n=1 Tax=Phaedon cochleariae TaxID=80249 RepID=A0A9N9SJU1_PHACE|nr:unnamed protein product [Phaedon cochleariae]